MAAIEVAGQEVGVGLLASAVAVVAWLVLLAIAAVATRQPDVDAGPATAELGPEPPAVANLLTNGWRVGDEAAAATALDLAARGAFDIEDVGPELSLIRLRSVPATPELNPYELMVYECVVRPAVGGVVATEALARGMSRPTRWWRRFRRAVIADARARGLSRPRWSCAWKTVLHSGALVPGGIAAIAVGQVGAGAGVWFGCVGLIALLAAERGTEAGGRAAAHWLGVREHLKDNEQIEAMPAAQVTIQGQHLAYAAALEVAGAAVRSLPIGRPADDERAWSAYGEEALWHLVRVRYPRFLGFLPGRPLLWGRSHWGNVARVVGWSALATVLVPIWALAALTIGMVIYDRASRHTVEGQVIRLRAYNRGSDDKPKMDHRIAIDDGVHKRAKAWLINRETYARFSEGDVVRVTVGRLLDHVFHIESARPAARSVSTQAAESGAR